MQVVPGAAILADEYAHPSQGALVPGGLLTAEARDKSLQVNVAAAKERRHAMPSQGVDLLLFYMCSSAMCTCSSWLTA